MNDHAYLHAWYLLPGIGSGTLKGILNHFESAEQAWQASVEELATCPGIGPKLLESIMRERKVLSVEEEWQKITAEGISLFSILDTKFPALLKEIPDTPALLYVRGNYDFSEDKPLLSVVGSRKFTEYGKFAVERLVGDLVRAGFVIVSGMAFGIDSLSHEAALGSGGETLTILGGGIDDPSIAPASHLRLAHEIMQRGAVLSEYPPGTEPRAGMFAARDRLIAGLSLGTLVIEAAEDSGSLITARLALDYNREVFAVPGPIFSPTSIGTNRLLKAGAKAVTCVEDILNELPISLEKSSVSQKERVSDRKLSPAEEKVFRALDRESLHVDKIIIATRLEAADVTSALTILEIHGLVKNIGSMHYIRTDR